MQLIHTGNIKVFIDAEIVNVGHKRRVCISGKSILREYCFHGSCAVIILIIIIVIFIIIFILIIIISCCIIVVIIIVV
jgi:hypothetical protein